MATDGIDNHKLRVRWLGIDTYQEPVVYMRQDCHVCRSEGFSAQARVQVSFQGRTVTATLDVVLGNLLAPGEAGLSETAWRRLGVKEGDSVAISHPSPLDSLAGVRAKLYGERLDSRAFSGIVRDVVDGNYSDVQLSAFVAACSGDNLDREEMVALTEAMVSVGDCLNWDHSPIVDKHCIGGLPGNRTTPLIVAIVASEGITMPKTSSRAITSPAGTADTMETMAPVNLDLPAMRRVVDREGGCIVWGGAVRLSPADDIIIRVEKALDVDSAGQLVASVLSKKISAGSTHVVLDLPVGPTAKLRSGSAARNLSGHLQAVAQTFGLTTTIVISDGIQPVGRGIGPALEARDVMAVLRGDAGAPSDLRERAVFLAGALLDMVDASEKKNGTERATKALASGNAWRKFQAICEAQGEIREPHAAPHTHAICAQRPGTVTDIDNRLLARVAKLAGAPKAPSAGLVLHAPIGTKVVRNQPLFTLHAETKGELSYALDYVNGKTNIVVVEE